MSTLSGNYPSQPLLAAPHHPQTKSMGLRNTPQQRMRSPPQTQVNILRPHQEQYNYLLNQLDQEEDNEAIFVQKQKRASSKKPTIKNSASKLDDSDYSQQSDTDRNHQLLFTMALDRQIGSSQYKKHSQS